MQKLDYTQTDVQVRGIFFFFWQLLLSVCNNVNDQYYLYVFLIIEKCRFLSYPIEHIL